VTAERRRFDNLEGAMSEHRDSSTFCKQFALGTWLDRAFSDAGAWFYDNHFDELLPPGTPIPRGEDLIRCSCRLLERLLPKVRARKKRKRFADVRHISVVLPLGVSDGIKLWKPEFWFQSDPSDVPPSLMLMTFDFYRSHAIERYQRQLDLPFGGYPGVSAVLHVITSVGKVW
jgi:hypothetical protein